MLSLTYTRSLIMASVSFGEAGDAVRAKGF